MEYYQMPELATFLEYNNGKTIGVGYFFHEKGYLTQTVKYLRITTYKGKTLKKGYFQFYNVNGSIKERGIGLFIEGDEELAKEIRIGKWKRL